MATLVQRGYEKNAEIRLLSQMQNCLMSSRSTQP